MAVCAFKNLVDESSVCGTSSEYTELHCISLKDCKRDVTRHLEFYKISNDQGVNNEMKLLLARAGVFRVEDSHYSITICPRHRDQFGLRWRCGKVNCALTKEVAWHKSNRAKGDQCINSSESQYLVASTQQLIPVGSPICTTCKKNLDEKIKQKLPLPDPFAKENEVAKQELALDPFGSALPEITVEQVDNKSSLLEEECSSSLDEITKSLGLLEVNDSLFSPDEDSITSLSTQSDEPIPHSNAKHEKLNEFLVSCGIEPLERRWLKWNEASDRTKQRYIKKSSDIISSVLQTISTDNAGFIWQELISNSPAICTKLGVDLLSPLETSYLEALAESYHNAHSWETRRQILSIMSGVANYNHIVKFIPGLTRYRYSVANLHRLQFGRGTPVEHQPWTRIKVDLKQLDHFLGFISSPHLIQDLPFGSNKLKLSNGQAIEVPNVIRSLIPERIARQYTQYCEDTGFTPFSKTTMLRVLSECSATVRKSLQGLDYYAAEGAQAFDNLIKIVHQMGELISNSTWETTTTESLKTSKLYLKGDYKVHIKESSDIAEHCIVYSMSDGKDTDYRKKCGHRHDIICENCHVLVSTLADIQTKATTANFPTIDDRDEVAYMVNSSKLAIESWQCHIIRCVNQDQARIDVLELLDDDTILVINDWAMKFIPQKYRESQADWYGKRGISWHISVVYYRIDKVTQWQAFIHIIQSCSQDSYAVVLIMQDVLATLKSECPEINNVYFRQDNAGCYHSAHTILSCPAVAKSVGIKIVRIDFSDPQGGKGAADRLAATCKAHIRAYINEGHDVVTAENMKDALQSSGGIQGVRVVTMQTIHSSSSDQRKIPNINQLNNFQFDGESITAWRSYGIGKGKKVEPVNPLKDCNYNWLESTFTPGIFKRIERKNPGGAATSKPENVDEELSVQEQEDDQINTSSASGYYSCPHDGCIRVFQRLSALEKHLALEKCEQKLERLSLLDHAKLGYKQYLEEGIGIIPTLNPTVTATSSANPTVSEGWALKANKKLYRFNEKQKQYLQAKFNIGQETGRKMDPNVVSSQMRKALDPDGKRLFNVSEFLSPQQVKSYFSRHAAKVRQQCDVLAEDIIAADEEANFCSLREAACSNIQLQHPIEFNQYNMFSEDSLQKLKLGLLQEMCECLQLDVPKKRV